MTPQEQQLLMSLTQKINQTQLEEKDPDAENLLGRELGANPDAVYILAQTVLVQNIALDQARAQVAQLQQQVQQAQSRPQPAHSTSFLGKLLGERDPEPAPPQAPPYQPVPQYTQPGQGQWAQGGQVPPQGQWQQAPPQYAPVQGSQPSFLRGAMQTAAGVAAGALAFEGVESVLHGLGGHGGGYGFGGGGMMGGGFERPVEETVVNNYYDEPGGGDHRGLEGDGVHDRDRDQDSLAGFDNSGDDATGDDSGNYDDADSGSGFDDGGGSDDGGGFDDGGSNDLV